MGSGRGIRAIITKRACVRLTLLLVAGAIVNIAVAWGLLATFPAFDSDGNATGSHEQEMTVSELAFVLERVSNPNWRLPDDPIGLKYARPGWTVSELVLHDQSEVRVAWAGWPVYSMMGCRHSWPYFAPGFQRYVGVNEYQGALDVSDSACPGVVFLPLRPIWPGFAINTVFYAAVLWGLFAAPFALRRRLRVKRGLCPKCAYDLRGRAPDGEVCPECGAAREVKS